MSELNRQNLEALERAGKLDRTTTLGLALAQRLDGMRQEEAMERELEAECARLLAGAQAERRLAHAAAQVREEAAAYPKLRVSCLDGDVAIVACERAQQGEFPKICRPDGSTASYQWQENWEGARHHLGFMPRSDWQLVRAAMNANSAGILYEALDGFASDGNSIFLAVDLASLNRIGLTIRRVGQAREHARRLFEQVLQEVNDVDTLERWLEGHKSDDGARRMIEARIQQIRG